MLGLPLSPNRSGPLPKTDRQVAEAAAYLKPANRGNIRKICLSAAVKLAKTQRGLIGEQAYKNLEWVEGTTQALASAMFYNKKITSVVAPRVKDPAEISNAVTQLATSCVGQVPGDVPTP